MKQILFFLLVIFTFFTFQSFAQEEKKDLTMEKDIKNQENSYIKNQENSSSESQKPTFDLDLTKKQIGSKVDELSSGAKVLLNNLLVKSEKIKSLMFNDKEIKDINNAVNSFKTNQAFVLDDQASTGNTEVVVEEDKKENTRSYVYLASILYLNQNNWTVWIGDKKITNKNNKKGNEVYITSLNGNQVSVLWSLSVSKWKILFGVESDDLVPPINEETQAIEIRFTLRPNQTYSLSENKIIEGKATPSNKINNSGAVNEEVQMPL